MDNQNDGLEGDDAVHEAAQAEAHQVSHSGAATPERLGSFGPASPTQIIPAIEWSRGTG